MSLSSTPAFIPLPCQPLLWENIKYEKRLLFQISNFGVLLPYFLYNARALAESKLAYYEPVEFVGTLKLTVYLCLTLAESLPEAVFEVTLNASPLPFSLW